MFIFLSIYIFFQENPEIFSFGAVHKELTTPTTKVVGFLAANS